MEYTSGVVKTKDNINIAFNHYQQGFGAVLVIAHGWFMGKDSNAFLQICEDFSKFYDVISFDFRGHCKSSGFYTFGAKETNDLEAIVNYAKLKYDKIYLLGFSLGSLVSINYCSYSDCIDKLIVVSAPVSFDKIENNVFNPNAFIPTFKKFELKRWLSIRFKHPFSKKPEPIKLINKVNIPICFIAGENDPIIKCWHNHKLFENANNPKNEVIVKGGKHAEDIYLENKDLFINQCTSWLNEVPEYV